MNYKLQYYGVRDEPYNGRILDISVPGHFGTDLDMSVLGTGHFGTDLDISVLGTGQFGTSKQQSNIQNPYYHQVFNNGQMLILLIDLENRTNMKEQSKSHING
jgi:hypothetical protein